MSNEPGSSLLSSLWRGALIVTSSVILIWIAVKLIEQIWIVLVVIAAACILITAAVIVFKWWLSRRRW